MKKVSLISLGCAKNLVDSENILGLFKYDGYEITSNLQEADVIVVNTCGFIESSKKESIDYIFEALSYHKQVIITGCLVQRYQKELEKEIPEADSFIAIRDYDHFNQFLKKMGLDTKDDKGLRDDLRVLSTPFYSAYLRIGDGCSNCCTYCAIPLIRGPYVSRPYMDIIKEAKELAKKGVKEVIVLEQDTTKYGIDLENQNIVTLLKGLLEIKELEYIRLFYLYPDEISDELIDLIAKEKRLTPYFDIPIQHSESHILKDMNRRGDKEFLLSLFQKIKQRVPHAVLRTTVMVGFPGESEEDVDKLCQFIEEVGFDHLGAFTYSKEEGTKAYNFVNQIDEKIKTERLKKVMETAQRVSYRKNKEHFDEVMEGIVVGKRNDDYLVRTYWNAPDDVDGHIYMHSEKEHHEGDNVKLKIKEIFVYDLFGEELI